MPALPSGVFRLAMTADLGNFQENLTPVLAARLNRSDRRGERLTVERAVLAPAEPSGALRAYVHYERFACAKAFGKEVVKRPRSWAADGRPCRSRTRSGTIFRRRWSEGRGSWIGRASSKWRHGGPGWGRPQAGRRQLRRGVWGARTLVADGRSHTFRRTRRAGIWYSRVTMSEINGDKARFHRQRKGRLARRERNQALRKKIAVRGAARPSGRDL